MYSRRDSIRISGVPKLSNEETEEDIIREIVKIGNAIGSTVSESDV